jgi:hypothetical protein
LSNARIKLKRRSQDRYGHQFSSLPWVVLDSPKYQKLSLASRALLIEFARQYKGDNNGRLLSSFSYLSERGWTSKDVITRAKRGLLDAGFIHETVMGHRPNKASNYALTWYTIDRHSGYDEGAIQSFRRGAYRQ